MLNSINDLIFLNTNKQEKLLQICKRLIETKLGWGSSELWTNQHYEKLRLQIIQETGIDVSVLDLKHLWGKVRDEEPADATLNALAKFAGYGGWKELALHVLRAKSVTTEPINTNHDLNFASNSKWKWLVVTLIGFALIALFLMIIL